MKKKRKKREKRGLCMACHEGKVNVNKDGTKGKCSVCKQVYKVSHGVMWF